MFYKKNPNFQKIEITIRKTDCWFSYIDFINNVSAVATAAATTAALDDDKKAAPLCVGGNVNAPGNKVAPGVGGGVGTGFPSVPVGTGVGGGVITGAGAKKKTHKTQRKLNQLFSAEIFFFYALPPANLCSNHISNWSNRHARQSLCRWQLLGQKEKNTNDSESHAFRVPHKPGKHFSCAHSC